jgi:hypothetical protein
MKRAFFTPPSCIWCNVALAGEYLEDKMGGPWHERCIEEAALAALSALRPQLPDPEGEEEPGPKEEIPAPPSAPAVPGVT